MENYILSIWVENEGSNFAFLTDQSVMSLEKICFQKSSHFEQCSKALGGEKGFLKGKKSKIYFAECGSGGWLT